MKNKKKTLKNIVRTTESQDHSYLNEFGSPVVPLWFAEKLEAQRDEIAKDNLKLQGEIGGYQSYIEEKWGYGDFEFWYNDTEEEYEARQLHTK
jgi:hypothetical protein